MNIQLWILIGIGAVFLLLLLVGGIIFTIMMFKGKKKYPFLVYNENGTRVNIIHAKMWVNPKNKQDRMFFFPNLSCKLTIKPPSKLLSGVAYREITLNQISEYSYLRTIKAEVDESKKAELEDKKKDVYEYYSPAGINRSKDYELGLIPEEKQIALFRLHTYQERYQNPIGKFEAITLIALFVLLVLVLLGNAYALYQTGKNVGNIQSIAEENSKATKNLATVADLNLRTQQYQAQIYAILTEGQNITRQIS